MSRIDASRKVCLMSRAEFIIAQLESKGLRYNAARKDYINVFCPFHEQSSQSPHLGIKRDGTHLHCWGCDIRGTWNTYAETMGLERLDLDDPSNKDFTESIASTKHLPLRIKLPHGLTRWRDAIPRFGNGPDISAEALRGLQVYKWFDPYSRVYRILFPVQDRRGRMLGWFALTTYKGITPKVRNAPGRWARKALFPINHPILGKHRFIFLVEGQADALRLISEGLPALCIMGVRNWTVKNLNQILLLGIDTVYILMDGDEEGRKAAGTIYSDISERINAKVVRLPEDVDPAKATRRIIKKLKALVEGK